MKTLEKMTGEGWKVLHIMGQANITVLTFNFNLHRHQWRKIWGIKSIKTSSTNFSGAVPSVQTSRKIKTHLKAEKQIHKRIILYYFKACC